MVTLPVRNASGKLVGNATFMSNYWLINYKNRDYFVRELKDLKRFARDCDEPDLASMSELITVMMERSERTKAMADAPEQLKNAIEQCSPPGDRPSWRVAADAVSKADAVAGAATLLVCLLYGSALARRWLGI